MNRLSAETPSPSSAAGEAVEAAVAPRRERLFTLLLALAGTLVVPLALLAAEGVARLLDPGYLLRVRGLHVYSEVYGWAPRRNVARVEDGRRTSLGSHGQRGGERLGGKPDGRRRLVVLGDSVAFGIGVSDHQTFAHLLQESVADLEVVNLAVQGYGTGQAYLKLQREALALMPDIVLLAFCADNDVIDAARSTYVYDGTTPKPFFTVEGDDLRLHDAHVKRRGGARLALWLADHSQLYVRASSLWSPALTASRVLAAGSEDGRHWGERRRETAEDREAARELTFRLVRRMAQETAAHGARFLVAFFPNRAAFDGVATLPGDFRTTPLLEDVASIDLTEAFRASGIPFEKMTLDHIGHLSPVGHRLAAEILAPAL